MNAIRLNSSVNPLHLTCKHVQRMSVNERYDIVCKLRNKNKIDSYSQLQLFAICQSYYLSILNNVQSK